MIAAKRDHRGSRIWNILQAIIAYISLICSLTSYLLALRAISYFIRI